MPGGSPPSQMLSLEKKEKKKKKTGVKVEPQTNLQRGTRINKFWISSRFPRRAVQKDSWTQAPLKCKTQKEYIPACSTKTQSLAVLHSLICVPGGLIVASKHASKVKQEQKRTEFKGGGVFINCLDKEKKKVFFRFSQKRECYSGTHFLFQAETGNLSLANPAHLLSPNPFPTPTPPRVLHLALSAGFAATENGRTAG